MKECYLRRFPQPARVGDLIDMPVLDLHSKTLGYVQQVVRTPAGEIEFIVGYSRWWGWFGRPVAVPLEALGIEGGQLVSLDMQPSEYDTAPTWHDTGATPCIRRCNSARRAVSQLDPFGSETYPSGSWSFAPHFLDVPGGQPARRLRSSRMGAYSASWAT
jgi:hypothetical protein